jgi:flagellar hook protein FlgE
MAFNIALSGLSSVSSQLDQISNNIANSSTYGFKSGNANFSAAYVNGIGSGVYVSSTTQSMDVAGTITSTGRNLDAAINGGGYFVVKDTDGSLLYTRSGQFSTDDEGYLVDVNKRRVQGYSADAGGALADLKVPTAPMAAAASTELTYIGNMSASWTQPSTTFSVSDSTSYNAVQVSSVYDSLGVEHTLSQYFVRGSGNQVTVHYALDGTVVDNATTTLTFDTSGVLSSPTSPVSLDLGTPTGAAALKLDVSYTGTTFYGSDFSTTSNAADGNTAGSLVSVGLDTNGDIRLTYSNSDTTSAGKLVLATFPSETNLNAVDGTAWRASGDSGDPIYGTAGTGLVGTLTVGSLESSNVEIATELVNLMSAQQNYQANSKVLTTESDMMKNLMQSM